MNYNIIMLLQQKILDAPNTSGKQIGTVGIDATWVSLQKSGDYYEKSGGWVCQWKDGQVALSATPLHSVSPSAPPVDDGAEYMRVLTTFEQTGKSRPTFNGAANYKPLAPKEKWIRGLPDTWQYIGATNQQQSHVRLTKELQYFWYDNCIMADPGHDTAYYNTNFNSLTKDDRWTTNGYGSTTCRVYPTGKNSDAEDMRFFTLTTGNAILKRKGEAEIKYGLLCYPFECINANTSLSGLSIFNTPHLFYYATNSYRTPKLNSDGLWVNGKPEYYESGIEKFPQYHGFAPTPLFMPYTNTGWIDVRYVRFIVEDDA